MKVRCLILLFLLPLLPSKVPDAVDELPEEVVYDVKLEVRANSIAGVPIEKVIEYISEYDELAVNEYLRTGVLPSVKIAVALYEGGAGKSTPGNNHFGIRYASGQYRQYTTSEESWKHQSDVLTRPRYRSLYENEDHRDWSRKLVECGYNQNEGYSVVLTKIIKQLDLTQYDRLAKQIKTGSVTACRITWSRFDKPGSGKNPRTFCQVYRRFPKQDV